MNTQVERWSESEMVSTSGELHTLEPRCLYLLQMILRTGCCWWESVGGFPLYYVCKPALNGSSICPEWICATSCVRIYNFFQPCDHLVGFLCFNQVAGKFISIDLRNCALQVTGAYSLPSIYCKRWCNTIGHISPSAYLHVTRLVIQRFSWA